MFFFFCFFAFYNLFEKKKEESKEIPCEKLPVLSDSPQYWSNRSSGMCNIFFPLEKKGQDDFIWIHTTAVWWDAWYLGC